MILVLCLFAFAHQATVNSLTFELEDRSSQCFYEEFSLGDSFNLAFNVISGGNYDVDMVLEDPHKNVIRSFHRSSSDEVTVDVAVGGIYKVCFSNYFSSISHKVVSMMWHNSSSNPPESSSLSGVSTQISESLYNLHSTISKAITQQFESRVLLTRSYSNAIFLHYRVLYWSLGQALVIILFGIGQVLVMRSFFTSPSNQRSTKPIPMSTTPLHTVSF
ncbi:unnamed protein product [Schistosoma guineensis]|uniref:p24 family protein gamma-3 n=1 Tax=Schistosoma bovis TaxID=6184 RepID=A0A430QF51_SCHBO|nr:p24 family protein gamma-3 [Schistosoma bovis]CAH8615243.1 unnamed protein product [Schistosoma guineensis]CAH8617542.1 unnamed protein product [Schistosoma bovis]